MQALAIDHLVLTVADIAATVRFYEALGLRAEVFEAAGGTRRHALFLGAQKINLHEAGAEFAPHAARPLPGSADLCLLVSGGMEGCLSAITAAGLAVEEGPVARSGSRITSGRFATWGA